MSESAEAAAAPEEGSAKKAGPKGVVLIGVLVGGLVAGAAAGLFAVGPMVAKSSGYVVTASAGHGEGEGGDAAEGEEGEEGGGEHEAPAGEPKEGEAAAGATALHVIDNLVLNPAGSGGTRFLMLSAAVEFTDAKLVDQFKARDAEVRDVVLRVMGAKSVDELTEMSMREPLRQEVGDSLAALLPRKQRKKAISRVFFPQFVIQ